MATQDMHLVTDTERRKRLRAALDHLRASSGRVRELRPDEPPVALELTLADLIEEVLRG